jgi:hypothetical protein
MNPSRLAHAAVQALPFILCCLIVVLHASVGRPIWIDEFTHFAFAAQPTTMAAWSLFLSTTADMQHGQTGIYIMLNYWTLTLLGPDPTLLRLPSILSGLFLFVSAVMLFRVLRFSVLWQVVLVGALAGQHLLMHYVGEARAYAPIPAAAVGLLLFYVARPLHPGSRALLCFGAVAAIFGSIMHPYFALYWPAVCLVAYVHHLARTDARFNLHSLVAFAAPGLVTVGAGLYMMLGVLTWLRSQPHFGFDPFQWLHQHGPLRNFTDYSHTQFISEGYGLAAALTALALLAGSRLPRALHGTVRGLLAPALLVLLSLIISLLIGLASYRAGYWILTRQWVGSIALLAVGMVWFWAEGARLWGRAIPQAEIGIAIAALVLVSVQSTKNHGGRIAVLWDYVQNHAVAQMAGACEPPASIDFQTMSYDHRNDVMVELANRNLACGGDIWPIFREYYDPPSAG